MSHSEAEGNGVAVAQMGSSVLPPSITVWLAMPSPARTATTLGDEAGVAPDPSLRGRGSHGEAEGLPTSGFSHSFPITSSPAPTSAVHRRCSLGSRPRGLCLGGNSIQMELFFHIFGGEGRKVWEKAAGTRKGEDLKGVWLAWPRFCTEWRAWQGN